MKWNQLFLVLLIIACFGCNKNADNPSPGQNGNGSVKSEYGKLLLFGDSILTIDIKTGTRVVSVSKFGTYGIFNNVPMRLVTEDSTAYLWGQNWFGAFNYLSGKWLFNKSYVGPFWSGSSASCTPVIKDSIVYITNHNEGNMFTSLYAYHKKTGVKIFQSAIGYGVEEGATVLLGTPLVVGGYIYVPVCEDKYNGARLASVFCFDRLTGVLVWNTILGGGTMSPILAIKGNQLFANRGNTNTGSTFENTYCLDATTGEKIWQNTNPGIVRGSVASDNNLVSVFFISDRFIRYYLCYQDYGNGHVVSTSPFYGLQYFLTKNEFVYTDTAKVFYYSIKEGAQKWAVDLQSKRIQPYYDQVKVLKRSSSPIATEKYIYMTEEAIAQSPHEKKMGSLFVLDKNSGKLLHELNLMDYTGGIWDFFLIGPDGKSYNTLTKMD